MVGHSREVVCPTKSNGECSEWAYKYMSYCICSATDWASMSLGLISVFTWTIAEIPQIITNYKKKSTEGLSLAFLATWIIGDIFNVVGCLMEPATLPTQYYTAVLYTMISSVLVLQSVYYGHLYPNRKHGSTQQPQGLVGKKNEEVAKVRKVSDVVDKDRDHYADVSDKNDPITGCLTLNDPINVPHSRDLYFVSARSLTKSCTPPLGFLSRRIASSSSSTTSNQARSSLVEPFIASQEETAPEPTPHTKPLLSVVSTMTFIGSMNLYFSSSNKLPNPGFVIHIGRKLLQVKGGLLQDEPGTGESHGIATLLGWGMAAIYMGGRIPQIFLNMKKGNVDGLNPYMFLFALVGNATYVASILCNSLEWFVLKPNLPWLIDAAGCVLLDAFILLQFLYFSHRKPKKADKEREYSYVA